jgi:hypothetical protein
MFWKIDGYLAIPHELLHLLAYRLIGKRCRYHLGDHFVHALETRSLKERLFVLVFPLLVIGTTGLSLMVLWAVTYVMNQYPPHPLVYFDAAPIWHKSLWVISVILLLYAGSCVGDIQLVIRLLLQQLRHHPPDESYQ